MFYVKIDDGWFEPGPFGAGSNHFDNSTPHWAVVVVKWSMVGVLLFYTDDASSNPAKAYSFFL